MTEAEEELGGRYREERQGREGRRPGMGVGGGGAGASRALTSSRADRQREGTREGAHGATVTLGLAVP